MNRDTKTFIKDILNAMDAIEEFVGHSDIEELKGDDKTTSAVIRKFEIIGEAAKCLPDDLS